MLNKQPKAPRNILARFSPKLNAKKAIMLYGNAATGKTSMAVDVAIQCGRPVYHIDLDGNDPDFLHKHHDNELYNYVPLQGQLEHVAKTVHILAHTKKAEWCYKHGSTECKLCVDDAPWVSLDMNTVEDDAVFIFDSFSYFYKALSQNVRTKMTGGQFTAQVADGLAFYREVSQLCLPVMDALVKPPTGDMIIITHPISQKTVTNKDASDFVYPITTSRSGSSNDFQFSQFNAVLHVDKKRGKEPTVLVDSSLKAYAMCRNLSNDAKLNGNLEDVLKTLLDRK